MLRLLTLLAVASSLTSCAGPQTGRASANAATALAPSRVPEPNVVVEVIPTIRARRDDANDERQPWLGIVVTNPSGTTVDVSDLRVYLDAEGDRASFRCAKTGSMPSDANEPATLAPGASFVFERRLDCALPMVGAYAVRVGVSFGKGEWESPRELSTFHVTFAALPSEAPREVEGAPGLWAGMGSSTTLEGVDSEAHAHTLFTLVNATRKPIEVPRMRLALRVRRAGSPFACEDEPLTLSPPRILEPGDAYDEPVEVSCVGLTAPGTYDISARLVLPRGSEGDREIALGHLRVDVLGP